MKGTDTDECAGESCEKRRKNKEQTFCAKRKVAIENRAMPPHKKSHAIFSTVNMLKAKCHPSSWMGTSTCKPGLKKNNPGRTSWSSIILTSKQVGELIKGAEENEPLKLFTAVTWTCSYHVSMVIMCVRIVLCCLTSKSWLSTPVLVHHVANCVSCKTVSHVSVPSTALER